jgi:serine/threonine protein kinase
MGVIHRDIKPQNILLSATGEAKVADFGIARAASATTMTQAGSILGTVHYISPEQALGELATPRSDLSSLGVVLYEMLTGELPYDADTPVGVVMKHVSGLSRSVRDANPDVLEELDALVSRLLARNPEDRPPDAAILAEELEQIAQSLPEVPEAERVRGVATWGAGSSGSRTTGSRTRGGTRGGTKRDRIGTGGGVRMAPSRAPGRGLQLRGIIIAAALVLLSVGVIAFVALNRDGVLLGNLGGYPR